MRIACLGMMTWLIGLPAFGQDRLKDLPGQVRFDSVSGQAEGLVVGGTLTVTWLEGGKALEYRKDGKRFRYDIGSKQTTETAGTAGEAPAARGRRTRPAGVGRGRQAESAVAPDGSLKAFYRDRNVWISDVTGVIEATITTDGSETARVKNGTGSWVYGEELNQTTAIWWSPDSKKLAYYRFDESKIADYYLQLDQTKWQSTLNAEPYPKAGTPNPTVDLFVHDLKGKKSTRLDIRDGKPFEDDVVGYYAWNVRWSPEGKELLFHRTNRRQNILELVAADPETGKCRVIVHEEWPESWVENNPETRFFKDNHRFLWASQRDGWKNYYLYDLNSGLLNPVTRNEFEADKIVRLDEEAGVLDYLAHDGDNPMKLQLHRVKLDGSGDRRLTDPALNHSVVVAPDGQHLIDVAQTHDIAPSTRLLDDDGKIVETLAQADLTKFDAIGLKRVELFTFKAADGKTELHGLLHKPSNFDPTVKYPVIVSIYGGPETNGANENFGRPNPMTEYGCLYVTLDARSAGGRGKRFLDAIYKKLGQTEVDDIAAGVKSLGDRAYVDASRVGVYGTSYGGYASALCLLKHPEVFRAACASSAVTDFRHYDTIYTERYMGTPQENKAGYDAGSAVLKAGELKGRLMIYYGTADDNVHPSNAMQLIQALNRARKSYEVQVGPDQGHSSIPRDRMIEFFAETLDIGK